MANKGKRMMTCYSMSASTCHVTSFNSIPQDDVSCHVNIVPRQRIDG
jgi:hypothetical protein